MDHVAWSMVQDLINRKVKMTKKKTLKAEFLPGGSRRQELLDNAVDYLRKPGATQNIKHEFCLTYLMMTETEYLECLNKATNGELVRNLWN
jgi:hypothetical protein